MKTLGIILELCFWVIAAAVVIGMAATIAGFVLAPAVGYIAAIFIVGLFPLASRIAQMIRRRRGAMTMAYLEQAVRLNLPISKMLRAAQLSERGMLNRRLAQLRDLIDAGYPVGMAIESAVPEVPDRAASIVESAERVGQLPQALARVVTEYTHQTRSEANADAVFYRAYPMVMMVVLCSSISVFSIYVLPKYEQIFKDFGTRLPPVTQFVLSTARDVGPALLAVVVFFVLISSAASLWQTFHPMRLGRTAIRQALDYFAWCTPILHGIERDRGMADVFELLHDAMTAGVPADRALAEASRIGINAAVGSRIQLWAARVAQGDTLADAARHAGMPAIVVGMLGSARTAETVVDVCGFLARYYRTRFSRTAAILQGVHVPLLVLIFGILVACVAISMFVPMVSLISNLSSGGTKWVL